MQCLLWFWKRVPVIARAVAVGLVACLGGTAPWGILATLNWKYPALPWATPIMAVYLWFYVRYLNGWGWPRRTAETRHTNLRARSLSARVWMWSLLAGATGMVAVFSGRMIMQRLVNMPHEQFEDLSRLPVVTVAAMLMMTSVVAGVIEEATFRGYMQVPIERRHGPSVAIGVTSVVFAFAHFPGHSDMALVFVPYITGVGIVFGLLATVTGSIRPSAALHGSGDALVFLLVWWMGPPPVRPLVFDSGIDRQFGIFALLAAGCGAVSVWSFPRLLRAVRAEAVSE